MNRARCECDLPTKMGPEARRTRDEHLALRCQLGEPGAFDDLVRTMERPLLYFARTIVGDDDAALDVLQAVWLSAFRSIRRLESPGALRSWLYKLTRGKAVDRVRREVARGEAEARSAVDDEVDTANEPRFDADDAAALHKALAGLDVRHREVLALHFLEDLSVAEVAAVVGRPPGTVKSRIYHAKQALREALTRDQHGNPGGA